MRKNKFFVIISGLTAIKSPESIQNFAATFGKYSDIIKETKVSQSILFTCEMIDSVTSPRYDEFIHEILENKGILKSAFKLTPDGEVEYFTYNRSERRLLTYPDFNRSIKYKILKDFLFDSFVLIIFFHCFFTLISKML